LSISRRFLSRRFLTGCLVTVLVGPGSTWCLGPGAIPPPIKAARWFNTPAPQTLQGLKGKVVLLDFWGVWCSPCRAEMPALVRLHTEFKDSGLVIIGVHTPQKADQVGDYLRQHGIPFAVAVDTGETAAAYGVDAFPAYVLLDRAGAIVSVADRPPDAGTLRSLLRTPNHPR
jgi:thiol-disulfide isomerase/thioredoxin